MANLPLAFAELLAGGLLLTAGATGDAFEDIIAGNITLNPFTGASDSSSSSSPTVATAGNQPLTGPAAAEKALADAQGAVGGPYSQAQHATAFDEAVAQVKATGTDCSGFVSWLLGPEGTRTLSSPETTVTLPSTPGIEHGAGQYITLWNNPLPGNSGHVFIEILGHYFQSAGGSTGIQPITAAAAQQMIASGDSGAPYYPLHPQGL